MRYAFIDPYYQIISQLDSFETNPQNHQIKIMRIIAGKCPRTKAAIMQLGNSDMFLCFAPSNLLRPDFGLWQIGNILVAGAAAVFYRDIGINYADDWPKLIKVVAFLDQETTGVISEPMRYRAWAGAGAGVGPTASGS